MKYAPSEHVLTDVRLIEEMTGEPFGPIPLVVPHTRIGRFRLLARARHEYQETLSQCRKIARNTFANATIYDGIGHTIMVPELSLKDPITRYALRHELGHAFMRNRHMSLVSLGKRFTDHVKQYNAGHIALDGDVLGSTFMYLCVWEGIADYIAIEIEKMLVKEGGDPRDLYCYYREWQLVNDCNPISDSTCTSSTPISPQNAVHLAATGHFVDSIIEHCIRLSALGKPLSVSKIYSFLTDNAYCPGHYYVRSHCENSSERPGAILTRLAKNPPESFAALREAVLANMPRKQAA